jgi:hypothetical protein
MSDEAIIYEVHELFSTRCSEVKRYFDFLVAIEESRASALARCNVETGEALIIFDEIISRELVKTMRANGYLLLYNLVESTMTNAVDAIHRCLIANQCEFDQLTEEVKKIVLSNFKKALSKSGSKVLEHNHPIQRSIKELGYDKMSLFSGNLDARIIKDTAESYGFQIAEHDHRLSRNGSRLLDIKTKRNELAHGRVSFEECGHETSLDALVGISKETQLYLAAVLKGIEDYVLNFRYKLPAETPQESQAV